MVNLFYNLAGQEDVKASALRLKKLSRNDLSLAAG